MTTQANVTENGVTNGKPKGPAKAKAEKPSAAALTPPLPGVKGEAEAGVVVGHVEAGSDVVHPGPRGSKPTARTLLEAYDAAENAEATAERAWQDAKRRKSDAAREIQKLLGKGPFEIRGKVLSLRERDGVCYFHEHRAKAQKLDV